MVTENNPFANEISHYTDHRLMEIIEDSENYSFLLVNGCRREAQLRNLNIVNLVADNPFSAEVENYSDEKLSSMLDGRVEYTPKLMDACYFECKKRGILVPSIEQGQKNDQEDIFQIQQNLRNGMSVDSIKDYLVSKGYSYEDALLLIDKAVASKKIEVANERKEKSSGIGIFGILFIVYIIIKWTWILSK